MSIFREIPPTAGFPFYWRDFLFLFRSSTYKSILEDDFKEYLCIKYAKVTYSGTAALFLILETIKEFSGKKTVIIPSFICPLVPLAIQRAGLKTAVCDIGPDDFNFNPAELNRLSAGKDILAIIAVHLGGIPLDFTKVEIAAKVCGAFVIEDCAQSLGAEYMGRKTGGLADFAFFSLCRGKGATIYEGGVAAANKEEYFGALDDTIKKLEKSNYLSEAIKIFELFGYWLLYRPQFFWFVYGLPQKFWKMQGRELKAASEDFDIDFPTHKVSEIRKTMGRRSFLILEEELRKQRDKAFCYIRKLEGAPGIKILSESRECRASYPYLTLLLEESSRCRRLQNVFKDSGKGVSMIYTQTVDQYDYLKKFIPRGDYSGGRLLAERHLTLSTNHFLKAADLDQISEKIRRL